MSTVRHCRIRLASLLLVLLLLCPPVWAGPGIGFLWQVQGEKPLYLLGSIHLAEPDLYPLDPALQRVFEASDVLVVEADVTGPA
ncbi:MAG: TraB/GumN family protein, partial [Desulfocurvibacter africanus]